MTDPELRNWLRRLLSRSHAATPPQAAVRTPVPTAVPDAWKQSAAHKRQGDQLLDAGRFAEAEQCYREALALRPDYAEALDNRGIALWELGRHEEAEHSLKRALEVRPGVANTCYNLGSLQHEQGKLEDALASFDLAIKASPYFAEAYYQRGAILEKLGRAAEAASCFVVARTQSVNQRRHLCDWRSLQQDIQTVRQAIQDPTTGAAELLRPFFVISMPGITAQDQKRYAEKYAALTYQPYVARRPALGFNLARAPRGRIHVGYLSCDLHDHATARLMAEVFELHDRSRFHVSAYSYGADDASPMRARLEKAFDRFVDIRNDDAEAAARRIYQDGIDILVDVKGYTQDNRCEILALRPAPIQVNYLGYPGTMGADFIDHIIADDFVIPLGMEHHYTEQVIRLQDCCQPTDDGRPCPPAPSRTEHGLPEHGFIFCCFNQTYKITPEVFDVWCRLLRAVPDSRLWLWMSTPDAAPNLLREAAARGVTPDRLIMAPTIADTAAHLARLQCADLFLDTFPVNAHTTCSDALWVGLPVLTCPGETFPSRVAGSLLTTMGVPELIAPSLDEYYRLALELATDRRKLESIRRKIVANRDTAPLFDSARFTRNLEHAYVQMMTARRGKART